MRQHRIWAVDQPVFLRSIAAELNFWLEERRSWRADLSAERPRTHLGCRGVVEAKTVPELGAWTAIEYPNAVFDEDAGAWISDAEIAEVPYTAFASSPAHAAHGRLIVRRVRELNPSAAAEGQGELFAAYRYHAVFTDSPVQLSQAESQHQDSRHGVCVPSVVLSFDLRFYRRVEARP